MDTSLETVLWYFVIAFVLASVAALFFGPDEEYGVFVAWPLVIAYVLWMLWADLLNKVGEWLWERRR